MCFYKITSHTYRALPGTLLQILLRLHERVVRVKCHPCIHGSVRLCLGGQIGQLRAHGPLAVVHIDKRPRTGFGFCDAFRGARHRQRRQSTESETRLRHQVKICNAVVRLSGVQGPLVGLGYGRFGWVGLGQVTADDPI